MGLRRTEVVDDAAEIMGEIVEGEGTIIVLAAAIAPGIPGDGGEMRCEGRAAPAN